MKEYDVIEAMHRYGGGFVQALAKCWWMADAENKARLRATFPEVFEQYTEMARLLEGRVPNAR